MGPIKEILAETQFQEELTSSSQTKLVVVDFTASWCGPCQTIAPFYEQLSRKYPNAVFLKVDVDKCQETAVNQRVSVMPTFHFYRNKVKVDSMQGADPQKLEEKIQKYYDDGTAENDVGVAGHVASSKKHKNIPPKKPKKPDSDSKRGSKSSDGRKQKMREGVRDQKKKDASVRTIGSWPGSLIPSSTLTVGTPVHASLTNSRLTVGTPGMHHVPDMKEWPVTTAGPSTPRPVEGTGGNAVTKKAFHPHHKDPVDLVETQAMKVKSPTRSSVNAELKPKVIDYAQKERIVNLEARDVKDPKAQKPNMQDRSPGPRRDKKRDDRPKT